MGMNVYEDVWDIDTTFLYNPGAFKVFYYADADVFILPLCSLRR